MAIKLAVQIHPSPAVPLVPEAYLVIDRIEHQRLGGNLILHLQVFASQADRVKLGGAVSEHAKCLKAVEAGAPKDKPYAEAQEAFRLAQVGLEGARMAVQSIQFISPLGMPNFIQVPAADVPDCMKGGQPDIALCYEWLMKQPGYQGEAV